MILTRKTLATGVVELTNSDPDLAAVIDEQGPPPLWGRRPGFPTLVQIILEQQVSLASARAAFEKLEEALSEVTPEGLMGMADDELKETLMSLVGVGRWTADIYLLMALRRPDVWPKGDLALAKAAQQIKDLEELPDHDHLESLAEQWQPWRAVAARILWQYYLSRD